MGSNEAVVLIGYKNPKCGMLVRRGGSRLFYEICKLGFNYG